MEYYNYIKSLHLIFVITWFSGLFYVVRLFVYHVEATQKSSPDREILIEQYQLMTYRLWYIITWPSAILATLFAIWLLYMIPGYLNQSWMQVKLFFVLLLFIYHGKCHQIVVHLQKNKVEYSSNFLRIWNEVATVILFAVVFLVILKNAINWIYGVVGIILFSVFILLGFKLYNKIRKRNQS